MKHFIYHFTGCRTVSLNVDMLSVGPSQREIMGLLTGLNSNFRKNIEYRNSGRVGSLCKPSFSRSIWVPVLINLILCVFHLQGLERFLVLSIVELHRHAWWLLFSVCHGFCSAPRFNFLLLSSSRFVIAILLSSREPFSKLFHSLRLFYLSPFFFCIFNIFNTLVARVQFFQNVCLLGFLRLDTLILIIDKIVR